MLPKSISILILCFFCFAIAIDQPVGNKLKDGSHSSSSLDVAKKLLKNPLYSPTVPCLICKWVVRGI